MAHLVTRLKLSSLSAVTLFVSRRPMRNRRNSLLFKPLALGRVEKEMLEFFQQFKALSMFLLKGFL